MKHTFRHKHTGYRNPVIAVTALTATMALIPLGTPGTPAEASSPNPQAGQLFTGPDKALGKDYKASTDIAVNGTGDSDGFHIMAAKESDGFAFTEIARLGRKEMDVGPWTGYVCTTGSGRYAAAVYAPSVWANKPGALARGALAAVVRLSDGKVTEVAEGVQLAYFSPGCGESNRVLFTSSSATDGSPGSTTVIEADGASGTVTSTRKIKGQLTHLLPTAHGDYGVLGDKLVTLTGKGSVLETTTQVKLPGPVFALTASTQGAIDVGTVEKDKSVVSRWHSGKLTRLGSAKVGTVKLFPAKGGDIIVGDVDGIDTVDAPGLAKQQLRGQPMGVSREGHLVTASIASRPGLAIGPLGRPTI